MFSRRTFLKSSAITATGLSMGFPAIAKIIPSSNEGT
ncbi:MAG: twin-arginine translocation signal domain-containing protein, partial [Segetibacter sp.]|nr:twin-arginine translocation signal domain-containing protein [Segetibacter sp.]